MSLSMLLDAIERTLSATLELVPLRAFHARLEPVHVVRHLERLLDRHSLVTSGGLLVPNEVLVRLNPRDEAGLRVAGRDVTADICRRLEHSVRAHGKSVFGPIVVHIEPDPDVRPGRIQSEVVSGALPEVDHEPPLPATSRLPVVAAAEPSLRITLPNGQVATFKQNLVTIGRGADNDVVISDPQASRRHAEVRVGPRSLELRDLDSTNGTWVNGARVRSLTLTCPARVTIGGAEIQIDAPRA